MKVLIISLAVVFLGNLALADNHRQPLKSFVDVGSVNLDTTYDAYVLECEPARFPAELLKVGVNGRALLKVVVDEKGELSEAEVLAASLPQFGDSALESVKNWMFEPAKTGGIPVSQTLVIPFAFVIEYVKEK